MAPRPHEWLLERLERQRAQGLYRSRQTLEGPQSAEVSISGTRYLSFCSNDYLGLASHPAVINAMQHGAERYGAGAGASHLITGHTRAHHDLEEALANYTGRARALLFSTGYMANLGVLGALAGRTDRIYEDRLNHASLIDGGLICGARLERFPHGDLAELERRLDRERERSNAAQRFIVTDGVFSMDGDLAPLPGLARLAARHGAWLMVDDAHGLGVVGPAGRGTVAHHGLSTGDVPILVGTLGKAFGTFGAFVAGDEALIEALIQFARPYIYTTAIPPAVACAALRAIELADEESWRREKVLALARRFHAGAARLGFVPDAMIRPEDVTPIVPLIVGEPERAVSLSQALRDRGILVCAIRPPTVPRGRSRLRVTLSAAHTEAEVDRLLDALAELK
jgi:8-amino-7-oxononanoate synthase